MLSQSPAPATIHAGPVSGPGPIASPGTSSSPAADPPAGDSHEMSALVGSPQDELETALELLSDRALAAPSGASAMTEGDAQLLAMIDAVFADVGLAPPESLQQARAFLDRVLGPVTNLGADSETKGGLAGQPGAGAPHGGAAPSISALAGWAPSNGREEFHFRSMILSRPSREVQAASLENDQGDEQSHEQAIAARGPLPADQAWFEFPEQVRRDGVDAPGGGPGLVAAGPGSVAGGSTVGLEGEPGPVASLDEQADVLTVRDTERRSPAPAGHWVSARAVAGMASGLILPNLIIIGTGTSRDPRASIRRTEWWWRRREKAD
jgi:hypothetical protein